MRETENLCPRCGHVSERVFHSAAEVMHHYGACGGPDECSICRPPRSIEELFREFWHESDAAVRRDRREP